MNPNPTITAAGSSGSAKRARADTLMASPRDNDEETTMISHAEQNVHDEHSIRIPSYASKHLRLTMKEAKAVIEKIYRERKSIWKMEAMASNDEIPRAMKIKTTISLPGGALEEHKQVIKDSRETAEKIMFTTTLQARKLELENLQTQLNSLQDTLYANVKKVEEEVCSMRGTASRLDLYWPPLKALLDEQLNSCIADVAEKCMEQNKIQAEKAKKFEEAKRMEASLPTNELIQKLVEKEVKKRLGGKDKKQERRSTPERGRRNSITPRNNSNRRSSNRNKSRSRSTSRNTSRSTSTNGSASNSGRNRSRNRNNNKNEEKKVRFKFNNKNNGNKNQNQKKSARGAGNSRP